MATDPDGTLWADKLQPMNTKTLILIPVIGISIGVAAAMTIHALRWLAYLLDTNDTAALVFVATLMLILAGTLRK